MIKIILPMSSYSIQVAKDERSFRKSGHGLKIFAHALHAIMSTATIYLSLCGILVHISRHTYHLSVKYAVSLASDWGGGVHCSLLIITYLVKAFKKSLNCSSCPCLSLSFACNSLISTRICILFDIHGHWGIYSCAYHQRNLTPIND